MANLGFLSGIRREICRLASRRIYFFGMVLVPLFVTVFFMSILHEGLPERVPTAVVDLDHSSLSRAITRNLEAMQTIDVDHFCETYDAAMEEVRRGNIFGFFVIPANFEKETLGGRKPTLEYYSNLTYFVPGTLAFKGFKTVSVATSAGIIKQTLSSAGIDPTKEASLIQPLSLDIYGLNNPWMNYAIYLCPSFTFCTLALMVMLMTVFSITLEIKNGTSRRWLETSHGSIGMAVTSKLLTHNIVWFPITLLIVWLLFGYSHFPMNGSMGWMIAASLLLVVASQAFGLFASCVLPNPRMAFIICALFGILSFSFAGFSFPVQNMYGAIGIFSYLAPIRHWFLIYINEALNGVDLYYSRYYFAALIAFLFVPVALLGRLKKACLNPVYVP